jgi:hypothetical protein
VHVQRRKYLSGPVEHVTFAGIFEVHPDFAGSIFLCFRNCRYYLRLVFSRYGVFHGGLES